MTPRIVQNWHTSTGWIGRRNGEMGGIPPVAAGRAFGLDREADVDGHEVIEGLNRISGRGTPPIRSPRGNP